MRRRVNIRDREWTASVALNSTRKSVLAFKKGASNTGEELESYDMHLPVRL